MFQSPDTFPAVVSTLDDAAVAPLAHAVAEADPSIGGISGVAHGAARFAGDLRTTKIDAKAMFADVLGDGPDEPVTFRAMRTRR